MLQIVYPERRCNETTRLLNFLTKQQTELKKPRFSKKGPLKCFLNKNETLWLTMQLFSKQSDGTPWCPS